MTYKRKLLLPFVIILTFIFILGLIIYFTTSSPQSPPPPKFNAYQNTQAKGLEFTASIPSLPQTLPTYSLTKITEPQTILQQVAAHFNLKPHPQAPNIWVNSEDGSGLSYNPTSNTATYTLNRSNNPQAYSQKAFPGLDQALIIARQFLEAADLTSQYAYFPEKTEFLSADTQEGFRSVSANEANLVSLHFNQTINSFPIYLETQSLSSMNILVGGQGKIVKLIFTPVTISFSPQEDYPVLNPQTAIQSVKDGRGEIVNISLTELDVPNFESIESGEITRMHVEYRADPESNLLYPYYSFSGAGYLLNETPVTFIIIFPAI